MITKQEAYSKISDLVDRFNEQYESYRKSEYNEALTRKDFIDPFFKALGWDMDNEQGYAEAYREVIHEDKLKIGKATKAPDYSFKLPGGKRLFFVEAKKPFVYVKDAIDPAYQLRRYAWSDKMPVSILTDFEEFAVYDCTKKPLVDDKASVARIRYITYKDYHKEFDFLWDTFSKERVLKGSFDKFIQSDTYKKGTATVDKAFLESLDKWRTYLATSIAINNKNLDEDEINFAVQHLIDRIIFLRIAEDRAVEPYGSLKLTLSQGELYKNLFHVFEKADEKYNSGLFDFKKDKISEGLVIENKIIRNIINDLYYPESPYEFSVMSVEILGSAYEQFLGKQIKITPAHHAKIEEKPEVRKAGGVYYTPQYIVEYIVKNTVGKLIEGKTPKEISSIKIVDPACGSGSFLLGAYQYLLDYHRNYYYTRHAELVSASVKDGKIPKRVRNDSPITPDGNLTTAEKKRILLNNIYGVDIDVNAVEVTKLSLLLKCMEGETAASIAHQMSFFHERILPSLDNNIKDGNSLIDTDYYSNELDFGEDKKVKPFNWQKGFPEVFKNGGFDAVIGNPPYFSLSTLESHPVNYFRKKYKVFDNSTDIYCLFFERGIEILKQNGLVSFITSNQWLQTNYGKILRNYFIEKTNPELLLNFGGLKIFQDATVDTSILILRKTELRNNLKACHFKNDYIKGSSVDEYLNKNAIILDNLQTEKWIIAKSDTVKLKTKIKQKGEVLKNWKIKINYGIKNGFNEAFIINTQTKNLLIQQDKNAAKIIKPILRGRDVHKYSIEWAGIWLIVTKNGTNINEYPSVYAHLKHYIQKLKARSDQGENWWNLRACSYYNLFDEEKLIYPETTVRRSEFYYDNKGFYIDKTCFMITGENLKFLNGLLSSTLLKWYLETELRLLGKNSIQYSKQFIEQIPVPKISEKNKDQNNEIISFVDQLLKLNEELQTVKLETKAQQIKSKIEYCEEEINKAVYKLYDLTEEEIKIVEAKN